MVPGRMGPLSSFWNSSTNGFSSGLPLERKNNVFKVGGRVQGQAAAGVGELGAWGKFPGQCRRGSSLWLPVAREGLEQVVPFQFSLCIPGKWHILHIRPWKALLYLCISLIWGTYKEQLAYPLPDESRNPTQTVPHFKGLVTSSHQQNWKITPSCSSLVASPNFKDDTWEWQPDIRDWQVMSAIISENRSS